MNTPGVHRRTAPSDRDVGLARRRAQLLYRVLIGEFVWRSSGGPRVTRAEIDDTVDLLLG